VSDFVADDARNVTLVATNLIVFGLLLGLADRIGRKQLELGQVRWLHVIVIGCLQALALVPGTSRSGITITGGLLTGLTRPAAARFAFLLYVPVMLAVTAKEVLDLARGAGAGVGAVPLALGFAVSALTSFAVIAFLLRWLQRRTLTLFVVYRVLLGLVLLVWFA
jgi:undecaprenyl-diphosphatase